MDGKYMADGEQRKAALDLAIRAFETSMIEPDQIVPTAREFHAFLMGNGE